MGLRFVVFLCPFCGRRFRVPSGEVDKLLREGVNCKFCGKHLTVKAI